MKKIGRPTKYKPIYCKKLLNYFDKPPSIVLKETIYMKNGDKKEKDLSIIPEFPTIEGFCQQLKISKQTLHTWTTKHKEFMDAYTRAKEIQEHIWLTNSMRGLYNPQFAIFAGKNMFKWKDKSESETKHTGSIAIKRVSNLK